LQAIPAIFERYPGVLAVYLFGSYAEGNPRPDSDLDLAIVPADGTPRQQILDIMADLIRKVYDDIDLVILDIPDVVLRFEVIRHHRVLYQRPEFDAASYASLAARMYWDFLPYLEVQRQAMKERSPVHGSSAGTAKTAQ